MNKIVFAATVTVMLAVASGAWAEDNAGAEAKKSVAQLQDEFVRRQRKLGGLTDLPTSREDFKSRKAFIQKYQYFLTHRILFHLLLYYFLNA